MQKNHFLFVKKLKNTESAQLCKPHTHTCAQCNEPLQIKTFQRNIWKKILLYTISSIFIFMFSTIFSFFWYIKFLQNFS